MRRFFFLACSFHPQGERAGERACQRSGPTANGGDIKGKKSMGTNGSVTKQEGVGCPGVPLWLSFPGGKKNLEEEKEKTISKDFGGEDQSQ